MILSDYYVHHWDPILFEIGWLKIRYYSLAYLIGLLLAWWFLKRLSSQRRIALDANQVSDLVVPYALLGVLIGGRLGYVLFYGLREYVQQPQNILKIWQGGMASHGGIAGVLIAMVWFARRHRVRWLHLVDLAALTAPMGLFLGRIANFINGELWGRGPTDVPWAVIFPASHPHGTEVFPRHPSQIYEALGEGLILFLVLLALHGRLLPRPGAVSAVFGFVYGAARIVCEQFREPDKFGTGGTDLWEFAHWGITRGQVLTAFVLIAATVLALKAARGPVHDWTSTDPKLSGPGTRLAAPAPRPVPPPASPRQ